MFQATDLWEGEHLTEDALLRFQQGDLPADALLQADAHLFACATCKARLSAIAQSGLSDAARVALTQAFAAEGVESPVQRIAPSLVGFPEFETIAAYVDGTLSAADARAFESAMTRFPTLSQEVGELRELRAQLKAPAQAETISVPPMIVRKPVEAQKPKKSWWVQWMRPLRLGAALAMVGPIGVIFSSMWSQTQHQQQQIEQLKEKNSRDVQEVRKLSEQKAQKDAQGKIKQANDARVAAEKRAQDKEGEISEQQAKIEAARKSESASRTEAEALREQNKRLEQQKRELEARPVTIPTVVPSPASTRDGNVTITVRDGQVYSTEMLSPALSAVSNAKTLPLPPSVAELKTPSENGSKGVEGRFQVPFPVTKVRDPYPTLRWDAVPGATSYAITKLYDETAKENIRIGTASTRELFWKVPADIHLTRGNTYTWRVEARSKTAPNLTAVAQGQFVVLTDKENTELNLLLEEAKAKKSTILEFEALWKYGIMDEAQSKRELIETKRLIPR